MVGYIPNPPYNGRTNQCVGCNHLIRLREEYHVMLSQGYLCEKCINIAKGAFE